MKKRFIITAISCCFAFIYSDAQEFNQTDSVKKKYTCFVKIETTTGENTEAALERFTADTVFIALLEEEYIKAGGFYIKILREENEKGIAVNQINSLKIKYDPNIVYSDEFEKRKKELKRKNAGRITGMVLSGIVTIPLAFFGADPIIIDSRDFGGIGKRETAISGINLHVSKNYQTFQLDGNNENYIKMVQRLTKSKANPFENNIAEK